MIGRLGGIVKSWERALRHSFGTDISTPTQRVLSHIHFLLLDAGLLRIVWTNFAKVAPDVYRSNQPTRRRLKRLKARGIENILTLRGVEQLSHHLFEAEACDDFGITLHAVKLGARHAPQKQYVLQVLDQLETLPKPFLLHCKSGADRAGFVSALYQIHCLGMPVDRAIGQMGLRFLHLDFTRTGILDYVLMTFRASGEASIKDWFEQYYDQRLVQQGFDQRNVPHMTAIALRDAQHADH